jgi:hypothetical protein
MNNLSMLVTSTVSLSEDCHVTVFARNVVERYKRIWVQRRRGIFNTRQRTSIATHSR